MVENESEALRWVTRQWERRIETDMILNVYGMLWEWYKSGRGGRLLQTVGAAMRKAREPNDKLDRATIWI